MLSATICRVAESNMVNRPQPFLEDSQRPSSTEMRGNVVLFPFMAHGHMNPFVDLACLLGARYPSLTLTLITTSGNLSFFRSLPLPPTVRLAALPFCPADHGLPSDADTTFALPAHLISRFYHVAHDTLPLHFRALLADLVSSSADGSTPLLCVITDMFLAWTAPIAEDLGVFHAILYTSGPYAMSIFNSLWINLPHAAVSTDEEEIPVPGCPGVTVRRRQLTPNLLSARSHDHPGATFVRTQAELRRRSKATLWNTAEVLEKPFIELWAKSTGQPMYAVGPLFAAAGSRRAKDEDGLGAECLALLDRHPPRSVVYVSFGSQNRLPPEEAESLAMALQKQRRPFLWAAPSPDQAPPPPAEPEESGRELGFVARGWVPQTEILAHAAVGAFVSHGGWNSTLESLYFGVPVVVRPMGGEQFCNAKLVAEVLKVGVEVARGGEAGEAVAVVMGEGERGREMRRRATELSAGLTAEGKTASLKALDEFVDSVTRLANPRRPVNA